MIEIGKINADAAARPTTAAVDQGRLNTAAASLDYNSFLHLLLAQMQNQDPLEPMKSSDYVAQLATFSQVEQAVKTNSSMGALLAATRLQQAEGLIGRTVSSADGQVTGMVTAARLVGEDVIAILKGGNEIKIETGVTISGSAA